MKISTSCLLFHHRNYQQKKKKREEAGTLLKEEEAKAAFLRSIFLTSDLIIFIFCRKQEICSKRRPAKIGNLLHEKLSPL